MGPTTGTPARAWANGRSIVVKRLAASSCGVRPPWSNQAWPRMTVAPEAMKLIATPETIWLPRCVIEAKACTTASATETRTAAASPSSAEWATAPTAPPAKAAASILPSSPMSKMPERSE